MANPILSVRDLHVKFKLRGRVLHALRGINLDVLEGESLAIVGESGCGKSVLNKNFIGLLDQNGFIESGSIKYFGMADKMRNHSAAGEDDLGHPFIDLAKFDDNEDWLRIRGSEVCMIPQDPMTSLNPLKTIGAQIMEAIVTDKPIRIGGNVLNSGHLISDFPEHACVEVPCLVNGAGIQATNCPDYPEQCAALNRNMINVQLLTAEGALEADREKIHYAVAVDPLTAAVCSLREIREMTDKLFEALKEELDPGFFK